MDADLIVVLLLLAVAIVLFAVGRPRMDVVALLVIVSLPIVGVLSVNETLAGFADPNVILIAALFVVGEGLSRSGVTFRLGDWLAARAGSSATRMIVLLMVTVAALGAVMSSTGVVAIFIPVVMSIATRTGISPRQLLMLLSMAGLMSGMLTLIATAPNLVVDAELRRVGYDGFGFFRVTPFGIAILLLGIGYVLFTRRFLGSSDDTVTDSRRSFRSLISHCEVDQRTARYRVEGRSPLVGVEVAAADFAGAHSSILGAERTRLLRGTTLITHADAVIQRGDAIILDIAPPAPVLRDLRLTRLAAADDFFDSYARQMGMAEVIVTPESAVSGRSVREARFRSQGDVTVLGVRHAGRALGTGFTDQRLRSGDTLLVAGAWSAIHRMRESRRDFAPMGLHVEGAEIAPAADRAPYALASVALMIVLMVSGIVPNVVAALIAALLMGLFRIIVSDAAMDAAGQRFGFFEFALVGVPLVVGAVLIVMLFGSRLIPEREPSALTSDLSRHAGVLKKHYNLATSETALFGAANGVTEVLVAPRSVLIGLHVFLGMVTPQWRPGYSRRSPRRRRSAGARHDPRGGRSAAAERHVGRPASAHFGPRRDRRRFAR